MARRFGWNVTGSSSIGGRATPLSFMILMARQSGQNCERVYY